MSSRRTPENLNMINLGYGHLGIFVPNEIVQCTRLRSQVKQVIRHMRGSLQTQHLTNLQLLQGGLNAPRHSIRSLKRGLSGPPYEVISARRHSVGKSVGLENSEREGGIITWRSLSGVDTR
jgi:hypothetical protein